MHPLRDVLRSHSDANMRWRYLHEETSSQRFEIAEIDRALTVIIDAYEKRWRVLPEYGQIIQHNCRRHLNCVNWKVIVC